MHIDLKSHDVIVVHAAVPSRCVGERITSRGAISTDDAVRDVRDADLDDYMHVVIVPVVLGRAERVWDGLETIEETSSSSP